MENNLIDLDGMATRLPSPSPPPSPLSPTPSTKTNDIKYIYSTTKYLDEILQLKSVVRKNLVSQVLEKGISDPV